MTDKINEDEVGLLCVPVADENPRKWSVAEHCGPIFSDDEAEEYDGWALVIEVRNLAEARMIAQCLTDHVGPGLAFTGEVLQ